MAGEITAAQMRALRWLARHDGEQEIGRAMIHGEIGVQTIHNLIASRLVRGRYATVWASGKRPLEAIWLTEAGRAAVSERRSGGDGA